MATLIKSFLESADAVSSCVFSQHYLQRLPVTEKLPQGSFTLALCRTSPSGKAVSGHANEKMCHRHFSQVIIDQTVTLSTRKKIKKTVVGPLINLFQTTTVRTKQKPKNSEEQQRNVLKGTRENEEEEKEEKVK